MLRWLKSQRDKSEKGGNERTGQEEENPGGGGGANLQRYATNLPAQAGCAGLPNFISVDPAEPGEGVCGWAFA